MSKLDEAPEAMKREFERAMPFVLAFWDQAAPTFFRWIEWTLLLAVLGYAQARTGAWPLLALQVLAYVLLWGHLVHFFSEKSSKWQSYEERRASRAGWIIGTLAAAGVFGGSLWLARVFTEHPL